MLFSFSYQAPKSCGVQGLPRTKQRAFAVNVFVEALAKKKKTVL